MRDCHARLGIVLGLWFLLTGGLFAAKEQGINTIPESGIKISVVSVFEEAPSGVGAPMQVRIENHSRRSGRWQCRFGGDRGYKISAYVREFEVEAGQTRTFSLTAPSYQMEFSGNGVISGPGVEDGSRSFYFPSNQLERGTNKYVSFAVSRQIASYAWMPFIEQLKKAKEEAYASVFDPGDLPVDWRGYGSFQSILITQEELSILSAEARSGVRQWVGAGGHLIVVVPNGGRASLEGMFQLPATGQEIQSYGYGDFRSIVLEGAELPLARMSELVKGESLELALGHEAETVWRDAPAIGKLEIPQGTVVCLAIGMAVLLGPVNFFWLAPSRKRSRVLWTTPLLSMGLSAFIAVFIFFHDGVGGSGARITLLRLLPGAHEAVVYQNQLVRTGLLLSNQFTVPEGALIFPMEIARPGGRYVQREYRLIENQYSGNWFSSRAVQAQWLAEMRPTRASIQQVGATPEGAPIIISSFENEVEKLVVSDAQRRLWVGRNLRVGEKVTLTKGELGAEKVWWRELLSPLDGAGKTYATPEGKDLWGVPGAFHAKLAREKIPIETLSSIRWVDDRVAAIGMVEVGKGVQP